MLCDDLEGWDGVRGSPRGRGHIYILRAGSLSCIVKQLHSRKREKNTCSSKSTPWVQIPALPCVIFRQAGFPSSVKWKERFHLVVWLL